MIRKMWNRGARPGSRRAIFIPCALAAAMLLLTLCVMSASANSAGRRTLEVARANRWVRLASASAFDEAVVGIIQRSAGKRLPLPTSSTETRNLAEKLDFLSEKRFETTLTNQEFAAESIKVGAVTFATGPWDLKFSSGPEIKVREVGLVTLTVEVTVARGGHLVRKRVTVQRYATAVPQPGKDPKEGLKVVVSPMDVYHQEDIL